MYTVPASKLSKVDLLTKAQFESYNNPASLDPEHEWKIPTISGDWWLQDASIDETKTVSGVTTTIPGHTRYVYVVHNNKVTKYTGVVNCSSMKVRPLLTLSSSILNSNPAAGELVAVGDLVTFANIEWVVLTGTLLIPRDSIGCCAFNLDWKSQKAQVYYTSGASGYTSTVKKYLNDWFTYWK